MSRLVYAAFFDELEKLGGVGRLPIPKPPKPIVPTPRQLKKVMLQTPKTQPQYIPTRPVPLPAPQGQMSTLQPIINVGQ